MIDSNCPFLVATFGNAMAADDAFGPLVGRCLTELHLPDVQVVALGMQPYGLLNHLAGLEGLILVDAAQATSTIPAGKLMEVDFFGEQQLQLVHDLTLSTHGLTIPDELQLARKLGLLPPRVRLVTATVERFEVGIRRTFKMDRLVKPAAERVAKIVSRWSDQLRSCCHA